MIDSTWGHDKGCCRVPGIEPRHLNLKANMKGGQIPRWKVALDRALERDPKSNGQCISFSILLVVEIPDKY